MTREQCLETSFPNGCQPAEKVTAGNAAKISDFCGSVITPGGEDDGQESGSAPSILFGGMFLVNDACQVAVLFST